MLQLSKTDPPEVTPLCTRGKEQFTLITEQQKEDQRFGESDKQLKWIIKGLNQNERYTTVDWSLGQKNKEVQVKTREERSDGDRDQLFSCKQNPTSAHTDVCNMRL